MSSKFKILFSNLKMPSIFLVMLIISMISMTTILTYFNGSIFQPFLGGIYPLAAILISGIVGYFLLWFLLYKGWFSIYKIENLRQSLRHIWLIILFTSVAILVDYSIIYPIDMNIPFPESLLFYPVMGFLVEVFFHLLPFSILLFFLTNFLNYISLNKLLWFSIFLVAILEPTYQVFFMGSYPIWAGIVVWVNLFLFNLTQLYILKRYDFASMYLYRLCYYLIWHIGWGCFRLDILF